MSHNADPERAASRHTPAIVAIVVALAAAFLAFLVFQPGTEQANDGIVTTAPPAGSPMSDAEGLGEDVLAPTAPEGNTPASAAQGPTGAADRPAGDSRP